jgi:hypothetical protein
MMIAQFSDVANLHDITDKTIFALLLFPALKLYFAIVAFFVENKEEVF